MTGPSPAFLAPVGRGVPPIRRGWGYAVWYTVVMGIAACVGDKVKQDAPHCHAPIHPPAPVPTPVPHPGLPLALIDGCFTVMIGGKPAATLGSTSAPCSLPGCVPGGPGNVGHEPE